MTDAVAVAVQTAADWLMAAVDARGGPCCIPERERWELYTQAKRRLPWWCADYEQQVRRFVEILEL